MANILIVDDRLLNREFLTTLLRYQHHRVFEASDGAEGLSIARKERPDLIISDVLMPTMDGYEFVRRLREEPGIGKTPVIFSTAHYLSRESQALAEKCGVTSIIYKPAEPRVVLDTIASALNGKPPANSEHPVELEQFEHEHLQLLTDKLAEQTGHLRDAHGKLTALIELDTDLAKERDPVRLLDRYCSVARKVIGSHWTLVVLLDRSRKSVQHLGIVGLELEDSPTLRSALLATGVFKTVVHEGRTIRLSDVTSIPGSLCLPDGLPRTSSLLVAPLSTRDQIGGWICLADKLGLDSFSEQDERLAMALAAKMAVAYDNACLYSDSVVYASRLETEISERARVERELSENRARLAGIINSAMDSIVTVDSDQRVLMFNGAAEKMFRCTAVKVIGEPLDRFIPSRSRTGHSQDIRKIAEPDITARAMPATQAVIGSRWDGEEFPLEASISQIEVGGEKLYTVIMRDVTDRKRAEDKVRESEQRLQTVIENLNEGLVVADLNGQLLNWNRAAMDIHGFSSLDECLLKLPEFANIFELSDLDGSVLDLSEWPLPRIMRGERLRNLEVRIRRLNADWHRVFSYGGALVQQPNGSFAAVVTMSDITDRKRAEERASRLASIVESTHDVIIAKTLDGIITSWNRSAQELYGFSAEEVLGRSIAILTPPELISEVDPILERLRRGDRIEDFETERVTKDGKRISVSLTISPIRGKSGAVSGWSTIARDITERNRLEEERSASELRYRRLFESAQEGILILNADTRRVVDANPYMIEPLGYSSAELIGKELWEIGFFQDVTEAKKAFAELQDKGYVRYEDLPLKTRDGVTIEVEVVASVYPVGDTKVIQCNIRDVTERKRGERALAETNRRLEATVGELSATTQQLWQASKLATVGELSASIAHELNNPLATVALRVENLLMQMTADDQKRHSLEIVTQEVDRMANLVDNLLQFSRRNYRQITTVNLSQEISKSVDFIHYHLRTHKIEVVREFADPLPTIQADCQQLCQLFLNLLTNASDAMPDGGTLTVLAKSSVLNETEAVQIDFVDTGEGIGAEDLKKIWEPFFTTKMEGKGTGLGLAICRRIVEEHGGAIEIESTVGRGTTVRMLFPATVKGARTN